MHFKITSEPIEKIKTDIAVVSCWQKTKDKDDKGIAVLHNLDNGINLDKQLGGIITKLIKDENFTGETAEYKLIQTHGRLPARVIVLIGLGKENEFSLEVSRKVSAKIASAANEIKAKSVAITLLTKPLNGLSAPKRVEAIVQGFLFGSYKFERYKDKKDIEPDTLKEVVFVAKSGQKKIEEAIHKGVTIAEAVNFARDLVNTPARDMTPSDLAQKAREIAKEGKLGVTVLGKKEIEKERLNLLLAVAQGSKNEPRFIHLNYTPAKKFKTKLALVGKGVTFDAGGYSMKPSSGMDHMKDDMSGAAVCLALMKAVSLIKPPVQIDAYIPATDNMVSGSAEVPGNIIKSRSGKTVEILNTDAEGRLILADALSYAMDGKPDYIIDIATLTGHVRYALGEIYTAVLGNNQKLIDKYIACSKEEDEPAWQLPLEKSYKKGLKESLADLNNTGKTKAGTIIAALFLEEFVGDTKWLHLDIAESSWADEERDYTPKGGTGAVVRTIARLISAL